LLLFGIAFLAGDLAGGARPRNASSNAPLWTAFVLATGNTLEAVVATWALRTRTGFDVAFGRVSDVLAFVAVAALGCTAISATIGVATLCVAGSPTMGPVLAALVRLVARRRAWCARRDAGYLGARPSSVSGHAGSHQARRCTSRLSVLLTHVTFGQVLGVSAHPLEYLVFPS
jgi:hypothetical protein